MSRYFIFAGEASGDLHGSHLIRALKAKDEQAHFEGVGGVYMRAETFTCFQPSESFQVMGYSDVLKAFPRLWSLFWQVNKKILNMQPDFLILIDYPGFNLRLARALRKKGYQGKIIQYICPSVWAHGKKRIETLSAYFNLLLTVLPFEKSCFSSHSLEVKYIGHPLVSQLKNYLYQTDWKSKCSLPFFEKIVALFPGSRLAEVKKHTSIQLQAANELKKQDPSLILALCCSDEKMKTYLTRCIKKSGWHLNQNIFIIPSCYRYELMKEAYLALAKSGTVTLELALHGLPTVVHYELSLLNYAMAKYFLNIDMPFYCLVNILGKKEIFPEKIGYKIAAKSLSLSLIKLHNNPFQRQAIQLACYELTDLLLNKISSCCASNQAAEAILAC